MKISSMRGLWPVISLLLIIFWTTPTSADEQIPSRLTSPILLAQTFYPSPGPLSKGKTDHGSLLKSNTRCLPCHENPSLGYSYVNPSKFTKTVHYKAMATKGIKGPEEACLVCHVSKGVFVVNPSENWYDGGGDPEKVSNDMTATCGQCHEKITKRFAQSLHATKKAVYYGLENIPGGMKKAFGSSPFDMYSKSCGSCHASCSSCHLIGQDKQVIDWKFVFSQANTKVGNIEVPIAKGITSEARILKTGPNRNPKSGGPLYRNMASKGLVPIETVKFDIEAHDFIVPTRLDPSRSNDVCYRCHENPGREYYGLGLDNNYGYSSHARAGMRCTDCHGPDELHGTGKPELYVSRQLQVRCTNCHVKEEKVPLQLNAKFVAMAKKVTVAGAHKNMQCYTCHAKFYGSCIACHRDPKASARYIETDRNTGKPLVYFGRNIEGKVSVVTTTPRRVIGVLEKEEDAGIWMMQSRHSIQRKVYQECEDCHCDPVKMGVNPLDRAILNTWEMASIGVPEAFIDKKKHLEKVQAKANQTCMTCHSSQAKNNTEAFHGTVKKH